MISSFSGSNYKAFKEFDLELKPLTILLGANSSGKSALINSLLMLSQSAEAIEISETALRLNGSKAGMGEPLNIIKDKNTENILTLSFSRSELESLRQEITRVKNNYLATFQDITHYISYICRNNKFDNIEKISKLARKLDEAQISRKGNHSQIDIENFSNIFTGILKEYRKNLNLKENTWHLPQEVKIVAQDTSIQKIEDCFLKLLNLPTSKLCPTKITYRFAYNKKTETIPVIEYIQHNKYGGIIFGFKKESKNIELFSDVIDEASLKRSRREILKIINTNSLAPFNSNNQRDYNIRGYGFLNRSQNPFAGIFDLITSIGSRHLIINLSDLAVNHVSPLRAFPQRYYLLDKAIHHKKLNSLEGTELAEVLKNNPKIKDKINLLLAQFNIGIDVEKVNDIIYKITVNQDNVTLELTDVGFGISQSLPILVQAYLSPKKSLTIIEQPEIHLHPNMQAWLADALISIALTEDKRFIIETHSDALIRRVRLRIVDKNSKLSENDVKIYHLHRDRKEQHTILEHIAINGNGDIKWPTDFMDVEIKDTIQIQQFKLEKIEDAKDITQ